MKTKFLVFDVFKTKCGTVYAACTERGLAAVQIGGTPSAWRRLLMKDYGSGGVQKPAAVRRAARQIRNYLAGRWRAFRLTLDWSGMSAFQRRVLRAAVRIPYGKTATYGAIADRIGNPRGARAVGRALGANPIPLVLPCHRVVGGGGRLGGYSAAGGVILKRKLLEMEGSRHTKAA